MSERIPIKNTDVAPETSRRSFVLLSAAAAGTQCLASPAAAVDVASDDRAYWLALLERIANPVLTALSQGKLKTRMPVEVAPGAHVEERSRYTYLEALGRLLSGISPWLESGSGTDSENQLRDRYAVLARQAIAAAVDPASPDFMNFTNGAQPVVDAAFLALGLLRAPQQLWHKLPPATQRHAINALKSTRVIRPGFNNWLLFSATVEAFLGFIGEGHDDMRIDYAVRQHEQWYKGDGLYGDGPQFHWDYYNSYVIHPMLLQVIETASGWSDAWKPFAASALGRAQRYAVIQERLIAPDGSFPPIGRSLAYRCGAFHLLASMAQRQLLPAALSQEQVRCALTAVIKRTMEPSSTFDAQGWLTIGFCGHQPRIAEPYISTGSLYLCTAAMLPLGLPAQHQFWSGAPQNWTSKVAWSGSELGADHALS